MAPPTGPCASCSETASHLPPESVPVTRAALPAPRLLDGEPRVELRHLPRGSSLHHERGCRDRQAGHGHSEGDDEELHPRIVPEPEGGVAQPAIRSRADIIV